MKTLSEVATRVWKVLAASFTVRVCMVGWFLTVQPSYGQIVNANLFGTVTDPTAAVIPGVKMTLTSVDRGFILNSESDSEGTYSFSAVPPGEYRLGAVKEGFKATSISGIRLLVNQQARVDVPLELGEATTTVDVVGGTPMVESATASLGAVIGSQETTQLPLNLRRYGALALLVPGTTPDNGGSAGGDFSSPFSETTYSANGARTSSNNYLIDGVDSYNLGRGGFAVQPPPDAVAEFKIQTNVYSAAFGAKAGSTINLLTKSGSNELHGTIYEFLRNNVLDARNSFVDEVPEYRRNQYGFAVGGPLRKQSTFWFVNFDGLRDLRGLSSLGTVPTAAMKAGDFSSSFTGNIVNLCGSGGPANLNFDSGQLFDPGTLSSFDCPAGSGNAGQTILVGTPYTGNRITNINPVAKKIIDSGVFPEPNRAGSRNFINTLPRTKNDEILVVKIDHIFGPNDRFFGRYLLGQSERHDPRSSFTSLPEFRESLSFRGQNLALSWTRNIGSTLLNEARFGFQRDYNNVVCSSCPRPDGFMKSFGIQNLQAISPEFEGHPLFQISEFSSVGDSEYRPFIYPDMVEKYQDNLTWMNGKHTITVGADIQFWQQLRYSAPVAVYGAISSDGRYSSLANQIPDVTLVSGFADFLSGYPSGGTHSVRFQPNNFVGGGFWNFYGQDDFKISPNLTLNLGLRYEYRQPPVDKRDSLATFVPTGAPFSGPGNGVLVTAMDDAANDALCTDPAFSYLNSADGRCLVASSAQRSSLGFTGRSRRSLVFPSKNTWAPRFGLAFRPTGSDKFIVRTGYGIFYDFLPTENLIFTQNNPILTPSGLYTPAFGTAPPLTNGVPTTFENMFAGEAIPPIQEQFLSLYVSPQYDTPNLQQWSFGISSQLAQDLALEVNYVGNKGTHQGSLHLFANQPLPGVGDLQPRRPYPDFNIMLFTTTDSNTNYNALQAKLTKRFSHGLNLLTSYTWGKSINDGEGNEGFGGGNGGNLAPQNDNNRSADRARSYLDARHRFVASYVWELPFGSGRRFWNHPGWQNQLVGGWEISGITTFQSGYPFTVLAAQDFSNTGTLTPRPDRVCQGTGNKTLESWFDTSCFTNDSLQAALANGQPRFGNSGRNILDAPGFIGWDLAVLKNFAIGERVKLQFRAEAYSLLNHLNPGVPDATIVSPNAGQIFTGTGERNLQFGLKLSF
jgi:Carboxypeptidase regulatory-like domain